MLYQPAPIVSLTLAVAFSGGGAHAEVATAEADYAQAVKAFAAKDYERAYQLLEGAFRKEPNALFVYNMGRARESQGRYVDAYLLYLRAVAVPGVDKQTSNLSRLRAKAMKARRAHAWLDLSKAGDKAVQIGQRLVDNRGEHKLSPGDHQICLITEQGALVECGAYRLSAGRRHPLPRLPKAFGTMTWRPVPTVDRLQLNEHQLLVDLERLKTLRLGVGVHTVTAQLEGGSTRSYEMSVFAGKNIDLSARMKRDLDADYAQSTALDPIPWVVTGIGALASVVGVGLVVASDEQRAELLNIPVDADGAPLDQTLTQKTASERWDASYTTTDAGWVMLGIGVTATLAGAVWGIIDAVNKAAKPQPTLGLVPLRGGVAVGLSGAL